MAQEATTTRDYEEQAARIADMESRLAQITDLASLFRDQVGTGPLVTNIRNGFHTILQIARGTVVTPIK